MRVDALLPPDDYWSEGDGSAQSGASRIVIRRKCAAAIRNGQCVVEMMTEAAQPEPSGLTTVAYRNRSAVMGHNHAGTTRRLARRYQWQYQ
jgi:hypothetical protein